MARPNIGDLIPFLKLGETSSTAYRGDRGKDAYDHISGNVSSLAVHGLRVNSESGLLEYWNGTEYVEVKGGGGGAVVAYYSSFTAVANNTTNCPINSNKYTEEDSILLVNYDGAILMPDANYTLNVDGSSIDLEFELSTGETIYYIILKSVSTEGGLTVSYDNTVSIVGTTNEVLIGIPQYDKDFDTLLVFLNSTYIHAGEDYDVNVDSSKITKVSGNWSVPSVFNFIVFKNVAMEAPEYDGELILDESIAKAKLTAGLQGEIDESVKSTDIDNIVKLTQAQYDALNPKNSRTLYIIEEV